MKLKIFSKLLEVYKKYRDWYFQKGYCLEFFLSPNSIDFKHRNEYIDMWQSKNKFVFFIH